MVQKFCELFPESVGLECWEAELFVILTLFVLHVPVVAAVVPMEVVEVEEMVGLDTPH